MANAIDGKQTQVRTAEEVNIDVVKQMAGLVASSLGPRGRDKMLVDNTGAATFTNDGATILRETKFEHPTTKIIVGLAKTQESEAYDGCNIDGIQCVALGDAQDTCNPIGFVMGKHIKRLLCLRSDVEIFATSVI